IGSIIGALAPIVGQRVGGTAGNVISTAGQFANMIPFSAAPQMAQQWPQQGQQGMAQQWPQQGQQGMAQQGQQDAVLVPQGLIGSIIGALAPIVGHRVGGTAGNVISTAGQFAHLLPFAAGPQLQQQGQQGMPQQGQQDGVLVPQGLIGNIIGALAPLVGHAVGGTAGHLIGAAGQQFGPMIPFSAAPQMGQQWPTSQQGQWPWQPPPASFPWATAGTA
ncbi:MAG: hypothetical protein JOZ76_17565, partial [Bradyrhizobium sp.]|nr:hypothetical protein [Bradyrhizobium sp.]